MERLDMEGILPEVLQMPCNLERTIFDINGFYRVRVSISKDTWEYSC